MSAKSHKTAGQTGSSLVTRLNTRLFFRLLGIYLCMDLLLLFLCGMGTFVWAEHQCADIATLVTERGVPGPEATEWMAAGDYTVAALDRDPQGWKPWSWLALPGETAQGLRIFSTGQNPFFFGSWIAPAGVGVTYAVEQPNSGYPYTIILDLESPVTTIVFAARVLMICQIISLIMNLFKNAGSIRKVLRPIQDLAAAATRLGGAGPDAMSPEELMALAGKLEAINATHLDARLPVDGAQKELKNLTQAINAMLDRINTAYRSQMRFVSDASHELRTPIAVIQGYANLLNRWGKDDPDTMQEAIDAIRGEADSMKQLVEQLLFLARGDNDSMKIQMTDCELTEIAAEVLKETSMIDQTHPLSADWDEAVVVHADPGLVKQALRILVDNACKYTPDGGPITLSVRWDGQNARLTVRDEGQGIGQEALSHIFDRFYRTDESRARQTGGAGLGLSIAKWVVDRHGGWFEVTSREGLGTKMTIVLPHSAKAA